MNDPGLHEPISDESENVEKRPKDGKEAEGQHDQAFLDPSRWWFCSTAAPLIAGTFGPMASGFSICALVVRWRVSIEPGGNVYVDDPSWLIGINAAQLAVALISNLFLLLNMARRVRFSIAQPITIIGWYLSSFTLLGLTACAAGPLKLKSPPNHSFSQAFYYAAFSAGLYFVVASLMLVTVIGAYRGHYEKEFKLTMSQRTLMLQTISFLVYLLSGAAVYAHIEGWAFLDAVYWADFTLLTVGIGDLTPATHLGRGLLFPYAIGGIIILGLVIGSIRSLVLERGKVKLGARMVEKERRRLLKIMHRKGQTEILEPITHEKVTSSKPSLTEGNRRRQEFNLMRKIQDSAATKRKWTSLTISGSTWLVLWFVGAAVFYSVEEAQGWSYFVSLYFSYTSLLTIGYGDFYPLSYSGKPFFVFWSLLAIPSLTILISNMGDTIVKGIRDLTIWVGDLTILPREEGVPLLDAVRKASRGRIFTSKKYTHPGTNFETEPQSTTQRIETKTSQDSVSALRKNGDTELPTKKRNYHFLLIEEIIGVMKHLNSSPPRKYTYEEWAWYLKLIGEDENHPRTHRQALSRPREHAKLGIALEKETVEVKQWSWIGHRSPLMGDAEEAEWVLDRLTKTLRRELGEIENEEGEMEERIERMEREGNGKDAIAAKRDHDTR